MGREDMIAYIMELLDIVDDYHVEQVYDYLQETEY